ncbi:MAG TPA: hypothetical protein VFZ59_26345, partial [Verrucomicrobiae bacterium]|nr:hypothetical protein [Verrucomicrobiae bacterium]
GITYTYTSYTDIGDGFNYTRISTSSADSSTESQIVTPMWYNNCVIAVTRIDFSGAAYHDLDADVMRDAKLIEVSARCWAKIADDEAPAPAPMAVAFPGDAMARLEKLEQSVGKSLKNAPTGRRGASRRVIA